MTTGSDPGRPAPPSEGTRLARSILLGLMLGSATFLMGRVVLGFGVDPSLIAAAFLGVSGGMLFHQVTAR